MIVFKIYLFIVLILNIFFIILPYFRSNKIKKLRIRTQMYISNFEYVISLNGLMGKGKTSLGVGLIQDLTEIIMGKIQNELDKTVSELKFINFNDFDSSFEEFIYLNRPTEENTEFKILNIIDQFLISRKEVNGMFTDYLITESIYKKLLKYCIRYYVLNIRGILVYSKGYVFNRITCRNSLILDDKGLEMINCLQLNNWQFELGAIYFDDEISMYRGNVNSGNVNYKLSGMTITLQLIRNMSLGTTYRITTKQLSKNEEVQNRQLTGSNIVFEEVRTVNTHAWLRNLLISFDRFIINFISFRKKIKSFFINRYIKRYNRFISKRNSFKMKNYVDFRLEIDVFKKNNNLYRKFHYLVILLNNYLFSRGYNLYYIRDYGNAEDIGKENTLEKTFYQNYVLCMPLNYVYGNYDTYEYFNRLIILEDYSSLVEASETSNEHYSFSF